MGFLAFILLGLIAGAIAKLILPGRQGGGWLATLVLGVIGALIGGWLGGYILRLFDVQTGNLGWFLTFVTALVGACILLFVVKLVTGRKV